jgi:hypothetical protein
VFVYAPIVPNAEVFLDGSQFLNCKEIPQFLFKPADIIGFSSDSAIVHVGCDE